MTPAAPVDEIDHQILDRLRENAREPAAAIGKAVGLTGAAVRRRIERLERAKVIERFTIVQGHDKLGWTIEAYIELTVEGSAHVHNVLRQAMDLDEVREAITVTGETDGLLRVRARDVTDLRELVMTLRAIPLVTGTNTRVILGRWWHGAAIPDDLANRRPKPQGKRRASARGT